MKPISIVFSLSALAIGFAIGRYTSGPSKLVCSNTIYDEHEFSVENKSGQVVEVSLATMSRGTGSFLFDPGIPGAWKGEVAVEPGSEYVAVVARASGPDEPRNPRGPLAVAYMPTSLLHNKATIAASIVPEGICLSYGPYAWTGPWLEKPKAIVAQKDR